MGFAVFTGGGGYVGWRLLSRTADQQKAVLAAQPQIARDTGYFHDNIARVGTAEDLIRDYRLLSVALKSHGLEDDIGNRAFIRKILESDLSDPKSLANRLSDQRYVDLARSFGFGGEDPAKTTDPEFAGRIAADYIQAEFELRVGESDNDLRIALNASRELATIGQSESSEDSKWFQILGSPPLAKFVQEALGLGSNLSKLPIDSQLVALKSAAKRHLGAGTVADLANPARMERAIGIFLARSQINAFELGTDRFSTALALLR